VAIALEVFAELMKTIFERELGEAKEEKKKNISSN